MPPRVAVVILNWNGWQDTIDCLKSLHQGSYPNLEVILLDNASTDDSVDRIKRWCEENRVLHQEVALEASNPCFMPVSWESTEGGGGIAHLTLLCMDRNTGFCSGNNIGMAQAGVNGAEYFLILNNDTITTPDFVAPLVEVAKNPEVGLVGGIICYAERPEIIWYVGGVFDPYLETKRLLDNRPLSDLDRSVEQWDTERVSGCMTLIPRRIFEELGGYYEPFFIWSDEWDYSLRVRRAGYKLCIAGNSLIYHKVGHSLGVLKPLAYYYGTRNNLLLKRMHLSFSKRLVFLVRFLLTRILRYGQFALMGRWDLVNAGVAAVRDYLLHREGKWLAHKG